MSETARVPSRETSTLYEFRVDVIADDGHPFEDAGTIRASSIRSALNRIENSYLPVLTEVTMIRVVTGS